MTITFVNGKQVNLPDAPTHSDIVEASGFTGDPTSRRVTIYDGKGGSTTLQAGQHGSVPQGGWAESAPDRTKGTITYYGSKTDWQKQLITAQVAYVSEKYFRGHKVELDDDCHSVVFNGFGLPPVWANANNGRQVVSIMLVFPDQYPELPTIGFYLPSWVQVPAGESHKFDKGFHDAYGQHGEEAASLQKSGWSWYCAYIKPGIWSPAKIKRIYDWQQGDSLREIIQLCYEVMTKPTAD